MWLLVSKDKNNLLFELSIVCAYSASHYKEIDISLKQPFFGTNCANLLAAIYYATLNCSIDQLLQKLLGLLYCLSSSSVSAAPFNIAA
jgi:hypothetical protein